MEASEAERGERQADKKQRAETFNRVESLMDAIKETKT